MNIMFLIIHCIFPLVYVTSNNIFSNIESSNLYQIYDMNVKTHLEFWISHIVLLQEIAFNDTNVIM